MDQSHKYEEQLTKLLEGEAHSLLLGLSMQRMRLEARWLWKISSWASVWERD